VIIHPLPASFPRAEDAGQFPVPTVIFDEPYFSIIGLEGVGLYVTLLRFAAEETRQDITLSQLIATGGSTEQQTRLLLDDLVLAGLIALEMSGEEILSLTILPIETAGGAV
jgi:hypothetical protein